MIFFCVTVIFIFKSLVKLCFEDIRIIPKGIHAVFLKEKKKRSYFVRQ